MLYFLVHTWINGRNKSEVNKAMYFFTEIGTSLVQALFQKWYSLEMLFFRFFLFYFMLLVFWFIKVVSYVAVTYGYYPTKI